MKAEIIVTNIMANPDGSNYAFAVEQETGDGVFIPVNSMSFVKFPVEENCVYEAFLTPNKTHSNTPWFCSLLSKPMGRFKDEEPEKTNTKQIEEYINRCEVPISAKEVFNNLRITSETSVGSVLHQLYEQGRIAKIIFSKGPDKQASYVAFCSHSLLKSAYLDLIEADRDDE